MGMSGASREGVVADEEHAPALVEHPAQALQVEDAVAMVATEDVGEGDEGARRPRVRVDRCAADGTRATVARAGSRAGDGGAAAPSEAARHGELVVGRSPDHRRTSVRANSIGSASRCQ